jgi:alkaline phosphatase
MKNNLSVVFIFSLMACSSPVEQIPYGNEALSKLEIKKFEGRPKNIIMLIGDGTGLNQITLSRMAISGVNSRLYIDQLPYSGISLTHSADNIITDSAAAATAWATGTKTKNKFISVTPNEKALTSLTEALYEKGFLSGVVATSSITHATPAAFYAHVNNRYKEKKIASQLQNSNINIAFGGGLNFFDISATNDQIKYIYDLDQLKNINTSSKRIIGLFDNDGIRRSPDRPSQQLMTKKALDILAKRTAECSGFFLMTEGSQIDWASHDNDASRMITEFRDFDLSIKSIVEFINTRDDTLLIVTADHETGGLQILKEDNDSVHIQWGTGSHTGIPVGVFSYGPGAELFTGTMDNTEIHTKILEVIDFNSIPNSSCKY